MDAPSRRLGPIALEAILIVESILLARAFAAYLRIGDDGP